jgi:hypothetical protein
VSIIFGEVLSRAHGKFEQQSGDLEFLMIIINYCYIVIIVIVIVTGRERTKQLKRFLGSLFRQPVTSHCFWFVETNYPLASSFGRSDNHIQSLWLHTYTHRHKHTHIVRNIGRLVKKKIGPAVKATCQENLVCHFGHIWHRFASSGQGNKKSQNRLGYWSPDKDLIL